MVKVIFFQRSAVKIGLDLTGDIKYQDRRRVQLGARLDRLFKPIRPGLWMRRLTCKLQVSRAAH